MSVQVILVKSDAKSSPRDSIYFATTENDPAEHEFMLGLEEWDALGNPETLKVTVEAQ